MSISNTAIMDYREKIIGEIELHSVEGIKGMF